tara:strand:+ start:60 stop:590 length:531 start_codon:yes stop_codon:yes gene_type:complete
VCSETAAAEVVYEEVTVTSLAGVQPGDKPERFEAMENASTQKFKKERAAHYNEFEAMQVRGNAIANTSRHLALEVDMGWGGRSTNGSWRQASSVTTTDAGGGGGSVNSNHSLKLGCSAAARLVVARLEKELGDEDDRREDKHRRDCELEARLRHLVRHHRAHRDGRRQAWGHSERG